MGKIKSPDIIHHLTPILGCGYVHVEDEDDYAVHGHAWL